MRSDEIRALLRSMGARHSEVKVYLALYRMKSPVSMRRIVQETGLSEKTARNAVKLLISRGLVKRSGKGRNTRYRAVGARALMAAARKKIEERLQELFTRLRYHSS